MEPKDQRQEITTLHRMQCRTAMTLQRQVKLETFRWHTLLLGKAVCQSHLPTTIDTSVDYSTMDAYETREEHREELSNAGLQWTDPFYLPHNEY